MLKLTYIRDEDYWIFPLSFIAIGSIVFMIYASPLSMRVPAAAVGIGLLWFTTVKVNEGYDRKRAYFHLIVCILTALILFAALFDLTN